MAATKYYLSKHAYLCACEGDLVLLDLASGNYVGLNQAASARLAPLVQGWPVPGRTNHGAIIDGSVAAGDPVRELIEKRLLTTAAEFGKDATPTHNPPPTEEIAEHFSPVPPPIRLRHVIAFARIVLASAFAMRFLPLKRIVEQVARRRPAPGEDNGSTLAVAAQLTSVYNRLRLLTFSAKDHCFFDSLVLLGFLFRFGVYPRWVFGVQSAPFRAHCWIQHESTVLNDACHHVERFTPIMVA